MSRRLSIVRCFILIKPSLKQPLELFELELGISSHYFETTQSFSMSRANCINTPKSVSPYTTRDMDTVNPLQNHNRHRTAFILGMVAALILLSTLAFGLAPRGSFADEWVFWNENANQTRLDRFGLVTGGLPELATLSSPNSSLVFDFKLTPALPQKNHFTVLLQLYGVDDPQPFIIGQWKTHFIVMQGMDFKNEKRKPRLNVNLAGLMNQSVHMQITVGGLKNELSINGELKTKLDTPVYELKKDAASISVGNSPDGKRGWGGNIEQLTISIQNNANETPNTIRDYAFNQNHLPHIYDLTGEKSHLVAPKPGRFPHPNFLQQISAKQLFSGNLLTDFILNIVGFMPLGFITALLYWVMKRQPSITAGLVISTLLFGFLVSIFIEYTQLFLPGRSSHLHDLLLNVAGQLCGLSVFALYLWLSKWKSNTSDVQTSPSSE